MPARSIPWPRILAEGFAIVVSILLAFGIQAWWEGVEQGERERSYLISLRENFEETLARVPDQEQQRSIALHAVEALIDQFQGAERAPGDSLYVWFSLTSLPIAFDPPRAVFEDAVASGGIQLIRSDDLRIALAGYPPALAVVQLQDEAAWAVWERRLQPLLEGRVPRVERLRRGAVGNMGVYGELPFGPSPSPSDFDGVLAEPALEDMLAERWLRLRAASDALAGAVTQMERIVSLIDAEIE
jgi:hypothetical protein